MHEVKINICMSLVLVLVIVLDGGVAAPDVLLQPADPTHYPTEPARVLRPWTPAPR